MTHRALAVCFGWYPSRNLPEYTCCAPTRRRHAHTEHHDYRVEVSECETSEQGLLSFALLASEWTQNAKDVIDTMLFKSKQEVQDSLDRHVSFSRLSVLLSRRKKTIVAACYHNHAEIKADVNA